jgi:carbamoyltransferase
MTVFCLHGGHNASITIIWEPLGSGSLAVRSFEAERIDRIKYSRSCDRYTGSDFSPDRKRCWILEHVAPYDAFIDYALAQCRLIARDIDCVLLTRQTEWDRVPKWLRDRDVIWVGHHFAHAASSYYSSGFDAAAVLVCDGMGDYVEDEGWEIQSFWYGRGHKLDPVRKFLKRNRFDFGIGNAFQLFTYWLGFGFGGNGTTMALSALNGNDMQPPQPIYRVERDGNSLLNDALINMPMLLQDLGVRRGRYPEYDLDYERLLRTLPLPVPYRMRGSGEDPVQPVFAAMAAHIQTASEEALLNFARDLRESTGARNLCVAGGVFLNVRANERLRREAGFDSIHAPTCPGDAGLSLGGALYGYYDVLRGSRSLRYSPYLGTEFVTVLRTGLPGLSMQEVPNPVASAAGELACGRIIAWCQGLSESGPRSLGNRSILADPRSQQTAQIINTRVKHREPFRPFAPSVPAEHFSSYFEPPPPLPFMLETRMVLPNRRGEIPAVVHADGSARVHVVERDANPLFHALVTAFGSLTGTPVLLNTSFNRRGEAIVDTMEDAITAFAAMELDSLYAGNLRITRSTGG